MVAILNELTGQPGNNKDLLTLTCHIRELLGKSKR